MEGNIEMFSTKNFYPGSEIINELMWLFVALIILHAKRLRRILISTVAYLTVQ